MIKVPSRTYVFWILDSTQNFLSFLGFLCGLVLPSVFYGHYSLNEPPSVFRQIFNTLVAKAWGKKSRFERFSRIFFLLNLKDYPYWNWNLSVASCSNHCNRRPKDKVKYILPPRHETRGTLNKLFKYTSVMYINYLYFVYNIK